MSMELPIRSHILWITSKKVRLRPQHSVHRPSRQASPRYGKCKPHQGLQNRLRCLVRPAFCPKARHTNHLVHHRHNLLSPQFQSSQLSSKHQKQLRKRNHVVVVFNAREQAATRLPSLAPRPVRVTSQQSRKKVSCSSAFAIWPLLIRKALWCHQATHHQHHPPSTAPRLQSLATNLLCQRLPLLRVGNENSHLPNLNVSLVNQLHT